MKIIIKITFFLLLTSFLCSTNAALKLSWAAYWNTEIEISEDTWYEKLNWDNELQLKQAKYVNYFNWKSITSQYQNNAFQWYQIDNVWFNSAHSLWGYRDSNNKPDQNVLTWITSEKNYKYDNTIPICGQVSLYEWEDTSKPLVLWSWTNKNVKAKIACFDTYSWCQNSYSWFKNVWYKLTPGTTFTDNAWNKNTCSWNLNWKLILIDNVSPNIDKIQIWNTDSWIKTFSLVNPDPDLRLIANEWFKNFKIDFSDLKKVSNWVSWIKKIKFLVKYLWNHKWEDAINPICSSEKDYSEFNPLTSWTVNEDDDIKNFIIICDEKYPNDMYKITKEWDYKLTIFITDFAWNLKWFTRKFTVLPWTFSPAYSTVTEVNELAEIYANNVDIHDYELVLRDKYDNPVYSWTDELIKKINLIDQKDRLTATTWFKTIINNDNSDALIETLSWNIDIDWKINFNIKSTSPWEYSSLFKIWMQSWGIDYIQNDGTKFIYLSEADTTKDIFLKPFIADLKVSDDGKLTYDAEPKITWTNLNYKLVLRNKWNLSNYSEWITNISSTTIKNDVNWHYWKFFNPDDNEFWNDYTDFLWFNARIDATDNLLSAPKIVNDWLWIQYKLNGKTIRYNLGSTTIVGNSDIVLNWTNSETLWLKVVWNLQVDSDTKSAESGQEIDFSDLSKWAMRSKVRKQAYSLIRNRESDTIINGVKYIEWDFSIWWNNLWYETLIIKDWDLTINSDLNNDNSKLGIILLKDNYIVSEWTNQKWNIYVENYVDYIDALIYSDWWIMSNWEWTDQLVMKGSIFSRNTIGWAISWSEGDYILPWWEKTSNQDLARIYDLNFIRIWNENQNSSLNWWNNDNFVIIYNPKIQLDPPKWFK